MIFAEWNSLKITQKCAKGHSIFKVSFSVWIWKHPMGSLLRYNEELQISSELSVWHFLIVFSRKGVERAVGKGNWKLLFVTHCSPMAGCRFSSGGSFGSLHSFPFAFFQRIHSWRHLPTKPTVQCCITYMYMYTVHVTHCHFYKFTDTADRAT